MFNEKLKEEIRYLNDKLEIYKKSLNEFREERIKLIILKEKQEGLLNRTVKIVEALEVKNKELNTELYNLREKNRDNKLGIEALKTLIKHTLFPTNRNTEIVLEYGKLSVNLEKSRFRDDPFPKMVINYNSEVYTDVKVEIPEIDNNVLRDIFINNLKNHPKLGNDVTIYPTDITILNNHYALSNIQQFIEDISTVYREANSQYQKLIEVKTQKAK